MKLSSAQKQALDPQFSCWVEASAGTGKTKVLTDRVLSLLLSGAAVSDILCLTFTKAAGAEMANRLRYRLHQWAILPEEKLLKELDDFLGDSFKVELLQKARQLFSLVLNSGRGIQIQTIHGFCQSLLKTFPLEAGLLPHFKIMSDVEKQQLLEESYEELWKQLEDKEIRLLAANLSETQVSEFLRFFLEQKESLLHTPITVLIENLSTAFSFSSAQISSTNLFFPRSFKIDPDILSFNKAGASDLKICRSLVEFEKYPLEEKIKKFHEYMSLFLTIERVPRKRFFSKSVQEEFPNLVGIMEEEASNVLNFYQEEIKKRTVERSIFLMQVAQKFIKIYEKIKSRNVWLDYDDLIICARDLLKKSQIKPWILEKLDYTLKHILVDEAQDTSQIQWDLILALIEEFYGENVQDIPRTLFVVGDLKQSIYSFQGASPAAFEKAKEAFQKLPRRRMINLSTSYRSTPAVLQFVDHLFRSSIFPSHSPTMHQISRHGAPGIVEIWPLVTGEKKEKKDPWQSSQIQYREDNVRRTLAIKIASCISEWLQKKEVLHSKNRPLEPKDIMILVRRRDAFMEELVRALKIKGVPVTGLDRMVLTDQLVVKDLLCLCDVMLLPDDDLSLATLLKSPLFGVSEEEIFQLCQSRKDQSIWSYMKESASYEKIVTQLMCWQAMVEKKSPYSFFNWILIVEGGRKRLLERLGIEIEDVLEEFLSVCQEYEKNDGTSLQRFVGWIRQQNIEVKRSLEQTEENQVRILTVHGAKGLQAPVVFLPDTTQIPASKSSLYWNDVPPFLVWTDKESRRVPPLDCLVTKDQEIQEYYRLLYVALTRAEDRLYICGWEAHKSAHPQSWYSLIDAGLKEIGDIFEIPEIGEGRRYGHLSSSLTQDTKPSSLPSSMPLPAWVSQPWKEEKAVFLVPSFLEKQQQSSSDFSLIQKEKGIFIHKILQWVVHAETNNRMALASRYIQEIVVSTEEKEKIRTAIESVLSHADSNEFFNKKTRTEVPIHGWVDGAQVRGMIDVLTVFDIEKRIYILDYKTGSFLESYRTSPPVAYLKQMFLYKKIVQEIYPGYDITSALLWTEIGWIQKL